jgi:hypothetical protein
MDEELRERLEIEAQKTVKYWSGPCNVGGEIVRWVEFVDGDWGYQKWDGKKWVPTSATTHYSPPADKIHLEMSCIPAADRESNPPPDWSA